MRACVGRLEVARYQISDLVKTSHDLPSRVKESWAFDFPVFGEWIFRSRPCVDKPVAPGPGGCISELLKFMDCQVCAS